MNEILNETSMESLKKFNVDLSKMTPENRAKTIKFMKQMEKLDQLNKELNDLIDKIS